MELKCRVFDLRPGPRNSFDVLIDSARFLKEASRKRERLRWSVVEQHTNDLYSGRLS